ncbi:MAG: ribosome silencing factor [Synergistaceae bacterium]|nr:ribosome silencing factor [Synergistaceae bacterium]MBR0203026.1 ribosome silencing factor [Synergistaceae bacterium]
MITKILEDLAAALEAKNGENIITLDLRNKGSLSDAFVLVTGNSEVHMKTLIETAEETLDKSGRKCKVEGAESSNWRLLDAGDVVVHVFSHKGREFYRLERLWEE